MKSIRRLLATLAALLAWLPTTSHAATLSDMWWVPSESGWAANVVQQADIVFITIYVYGPDGKPMWYVAPQMLHDKTVTNELVFAGDLYATTGPPLGGSYSPALVTNRVVGRMTLRSQSSIEATLTYTVDGVSVSKTIYRYTYVLRNPEGTYQGSVVRRPESDCLGTPVTHNNPINTSFTITITSGAIGTGPYTFNMSFLEGSIMRGRLEQFGALIDILGTFTWGTTTYDANVQEMTADDDGIRGKISARHRVTGCLIHFRFAGVAVQ